MGFIQTTMNRLRVFILFLAASCWTASAQTPSGNSASTTRPVQLQNAGVEEVLDLYAQLVHRTVLHGTLPVSKFSFDIPATNKTAVTEIIVKALKEKGLTSVLDGEKFVLVVTEAQASKVVPHSSQIKSPGEKANGTLSFSSLPLSETLTVYAQLAGASGFEQTSEFACPYLFITLKTQTSMTKAEAIYALDTIFRLNGFKMVPASNNRIKAVWLSNSPL